MKTFFKKQFSAKYTTEGTFKSINDSDGFSIDGSVLISQNTTGPRTKIILDVPHGNIGVALSELTTMSKTGLYKAPANIQYINNRYIMTDNQYVYESTDQGQTWQQHYLPQLLQIGELVINPGTGAVVIGSGIAVYKDTSLGIVVDLFKMSKVSIAYGQMAITRANYTDSYGVDTLFKSVYKTTGIGNSEIGYIRLGGVWCGYSIILPDENIPINKRGIKISPTEINEVVTYNEFGVHWDPLGYNSYYGTYTGGAVSLYDSYQIACCEGGYIQYRLLASYDDSSTNTVPFKQIYIGSDANVYTSAIMKFIYDGTTSNESQATRTFFEKRYIFTSEGIGELLWDGNDLSYAIVYNATIPNIALTLQEHVSKYQAGTEVHKLYAYAIDGSIIVIDASNKQIAPQVSIISTGVTFKHYLESSYITTYDNKLYTLANYTQLTFKGQFEHPIVDIKTTMPNLLLVHTTQNKVLFNQSSGVQEKSDYELSYPNPKPSVFFTNGHYICVISNRIYFSYDLITWTFKAFCLSNLLSIKSIIYINNLYYIINQTDFCSFDGTNFEYFNTYFIGLGDKFATLNTFLNGYINIYGNGYVTKGYRLPVINRAPIDVNDYTTIDTLATISFNAYASAYTAKLVLRGRLGNCSISIKTNDGNERYITYDYNELNSLESGRICYIQIGPYENFVQEIKSFTIVIKAQRCYTLSMDLAVLDFYSIDNYSQRLETLFGDNFDTTVTHTGLTPAGLITIPFKYYENTSQYIKDLFKLNDVTGGCLLGYDDKTILVTINSSRVIVDIYEYDNQQNDFIAIPSGPKRLDFLANSYCNWPISVNNYFGLISSAASLTRYTSDGTVIENISMYKKIINRYSQANSVMTGQSGLIDKQSAFMLTCNDMAFANDYALAVGNDGYITFRSTQYNVCKQLIPNLNLEVASYSLYSANYLNSYSPRFFILGNAGFIAWFDSDITNITVSYLGTANLIDILVVDNIICVLSQDSVIYRSVDNGLNWTSLGQIGSAGDYIGLVRNPANGATVAYGHNNISRSIDLLNWSVVSTGLTFEATTASELKGFIYIGCKEGKLLRSADGYNWQYVVTNSSSDFYYLQSLYGYPDVYGNTINIINDWALFYAFDTSEASFKTLITTGDRLAVSTLGYVTILDVYDGYFRAQIESPLNKPYANSQYDFGHFMTIEEIYQKPSFKAFSDSNCTNELSLDIYSAVSIAVQLDTITVTFETDPSRIEYIVLYIAMYQSSYYKCGKYIARKVETFDAIAKTVTFTVPLDAGWSLCNYTFNEYAYFSMPIYGIPYNSLYMKFIEDQFKLETCYQAIWLKNTNSLNMYDRLVITSRNPMKDYNFKFSTIPTSYVSSIHNAEPVKNMLVDYQFAVRLVSTKSYTEANLDIYYQLATITTDKVYLENRVGVGSSIVSRGQVLKVLSTEAAEAAGVDLVGDSSYDFANLKIELEIIDRSCIKKNNIGNNCLEGVLVTEDYITTLDMSISMDINDIGNTPYSVFVRTTGSFVGLQDDYDLIISNFYISSDRWTYISDTCLQIVAYRETTDYKTTYLLPFKNYTGVLKCVKVTESFNYSSTSLQNQYEYSLGSLEFSTTPDENIWKRTLQLPPIIGSTPLKVNVRQSVVNNGAKLLPMNIIRISGIEYKI